MNALVSGELFFKIIVCKRYLDLNATVTTLWLNLTNLDEYVTTNGSDIIAFNAYMQSQVDRLGLQGKTTNDLIINLFKGYKALQDKLFQEYLHTLENGHDSRSESQQHKH